MGASTAAVRHYPVWPATSIKSDELFKLIAYIVYFISVLSEGWIIFRFADHLAESRNPVRETIRSRVVLWFILLFCAVCVCYQTSGAYANQCRAICIFI